ncbi:MAG: hypothetical protein WC943_06805 [Elusimicrobiota bacterium]|jgi:hypothetical protein
MDLYLLAHPDPAPKAAAAAGRHVRVLCFGWEALRQSRELGLDALPWEDLVPEEGVGELRRFILELADSWYRDGGEDPTLFQGVSLGKAERYVVWPYVLHPAFKFLAALQAVLAAGTVEAVFCQISVPPVYRRVLAAVQAQKGSPRVEWVGDGYGVAPDPFQEAAARMRFSPGSAAKRWGYRLLNALGSAGGFIASGRRKTVLACYYSPLDGMFERMGDPSSPFCCSFVTRPPLRHFARTLRIGGAVTDLRGEDPRLSPGQTEGLDAIRRRWLGLKKRPGFADRFLWRGVCLWPVVQPFLDGFFQDEIASLARLVVFLEERWRKDAPSLVLLPSDGPPFQQLMTEVARSHGTPSVVILHGLPGEYDCPFDSTSSDYFMVWGCEQKRLFQETAVFASKNVVAVGNPYFDQFRSTGAGRGRPVPERIRKVVVLTSPVNTAYLLSSDLDPQRYVETALGVLERCGGFETTLRLHPGERLGPYLRLVADHPGVRVERLGDLRRCFESADLVLGTFTTASLAAVIMGKPLMVLKFDRSTYVPPFDGSWGLEPVRTAEELEARLREALRSPSEFAARLREPYRRILEAFAGPLDGSSSRRVLEELERLCRDSDP